MRKILVVAAGIALLGWTAVAEAGSREATEEVLKVGFDVSRGGTLRVDLPDADIDIRPGASDRVELKLMLGARDMEWARQRVEAMDINIDGRGSDVVVEGHDTRQRTRWQPGDWFQLILRVELPEDFNVDLSSADGDIRVDRLNGRMKIRTSDGDITLGRIDASVADIATSDGDVAVAELAGGEIEIKSSDGDISIRRLDVAQATIRTSDGDISLDDASGEIDAATSDGDIELVGTRLGRTTLGSGDGDITIRLDGGADVELKGEEVDVRAAFDGDKKETWATGRVNGGGPLLRATTRDGTVEVRSGR